MMEGIINVWLAEYCENTLTDDEDTLAWVVTEQDLGELEERINMEVEGRHSILESDLKHLRDVMKRQQVVKDTLMEVIERIAAIG
jgi:hypothetical protein